MVVPDHRQPPGPSTPMRGKQRGRIDLERPRRVRRYVRARSDRFDPPRRPEQQPTHLRIRRRSRFCDQPPQQFA